MLTETGRVVALDPDGVWVETEKQSVCGQCQARHGCGQKILGEMGANMTHIKALYPASVLTTSPTDTHLVNVGDEVEIGIDEGAFLQATFVSYGVPLGAALVSVFCASKFNLNEPLMLLAGFVGLLLGGVVVRRSTRMLATRNCYQAMFIGKVAKQNDIQSVEISSPLV
ncbi:SoxR reducing system RseC family protein [Teredinibacter waterburyi]|jgi:Positive regulator of sigma E activity|uniref:SoxR reducing system RseC family protein n=1 Tax=Teredinibacter waterburyi TaxID=1500538 RepID=UPI00165FB03A|nr:SoxR reducing system RseC family protein [Teredinibacter waterburyi]